MKTPMHEFIRARRDAILSRTLRKMQASFPDRSEAELLDTLPAFLDEIAAALRRDAGLVSSSPLPAASDFAARHGSHRHRYRFDIVSVARSYGTLCDAINEIAVEEALEFPMRDHQLLHLCIDSGIAVAIDQYWNESRVEADRRVRERVSFMAHELRNALSAAAMAFSAIKTGTVGVQSKTGEVLGRCLARMNDLIQHTLAEAHLRALPLCRRRMRMGELLEELETAHCCARAEQVRFDVDPTIEIEVESRLLTSALANLVQNGVKFTPEGGTVEVRARRSAESVLIEVEDQCGGLPPGDPEALFEPFVHQPGAQAGVGLGLAIAREAVEAHGGRLTVRDLPGRGCIFTIRLPAC